jgi:hypothetical protein
MAADVNGSLKETLGEGGTSEEGWTSRLHSTLWVSSSRLLLF